MQTRPLSLTIIGWLLIVFSLFGLFGVVTMGSNAAAMKMLEQMHTSLLFQQVWGVLGAIINVAVAYGIFKGLPWSRVLYVVWGVVGLVVAAYTSPIKVAVVVGLIFLVVISAFLFTNSANDWFCARGMMLKRERS
jgi:hypothetical protein